MSSSFLSWTNPAECELLREILAAKTLAEFCERGGKVTCTRGRTEGGVILSLPPFVFPYFPLTVAYEVSKAPRSSSRLTNPPPPGPSGDAEPFPMSTHEDKTEM